MLHSFTSFYVLFQVIKKIFMLVDDGGMSSSLALSVFHVHVSVVATFLLFAGWGTSSFGLYHFRLTHL